MEPYQLTPHERVQLDPLYFQRAAQASVHEQARLYANPEYRPKNFTEATMHFEGDARTIRAPRGQQLRHVRGGKMPANFWAPASTMRRFGLNPADQVSIAPKRRSRWHNAPSTFVLPQPEPKAIPGYKRVVKWQDYRQDRVHAALSIQKQPLYYGQPAYGYTQVPVEYRPLTARESLDPFAHTRFEDRF
jgi:hypothetical protein